MTQEDQELNGVDRYTYARPHDAVITHLDLDIKVNFVNKKITGKASFQINNKTGVDKIFFDTKHIDIERVTIGTEEEKTEFALVGFREFLGRKLEISILPSTEVVNIYYSTRPEAMALQWLSPQQTVEKNYPFLYTQSEPTYARSWIPTQDSPGIRFTYNARVEVPKELMAVMSASNPQEKNADGIYEFEMKQPIPGYLIALAVGDFSFKSTGPRSGVYAEASVVDAAAQEFGELEEMIDAVEKLYGPYRWERYDLIVLPPSFPFGGMENPRLTFATPTIIAGDRSLVSVVAHELSHSWSGNLVTSATWNDFWINEGFTVYLERRIMEELYGASYTRMLRLIGYQDLEGTIELMGETSMDTHLKLQLDGRDPDEALTDIAYEKGALFLQVVEEAVGRERWDEYLKNYFDKFAFQSMSTEKFLDHMRETLMNGDADLAKQINIDAWVYGPGLPDNCPVVKSERFELIDEAVSKWVAGENAEALGAKEWYTHEWLHFLRHLPNEISTERMAELDQSFNLSNSQNSEIIAAWFIHVINNNYEVVYDKLEAFLVKVGRRKFLAPLYKELAKTEANKKIGIAIYKKARTNYHQISTVTIDGILGWEDARYLMQE
ncbi:MAG: M1 family metallopeptidase [Flavobacteriales bacterium]|nr:M1 family metallopeptidase [Flavobacteriales bacterium]